MKKTNLVLFLAFFLALSMVAAACGSSNNQAYPGSTEAVTGTEEAFPTESTGGLPNTGGATLAVPTTEATGAATTAATEAPTVAATTQPTVKATVVATEVMTATAISAQPLPATGIVDAGRLSNLLKFDVYNTNNEKIGTVKDMVLDFDTQMIDFALVDVGGFLGIGAKEVVVPYACLQAVTSSSMGGTGSTNSNLNSNTNSNSNGNLNSNTNTNANSNSNTNTNTSLSAGTTGQTNIFILNVTQDELSAFPTFDRNTFPQFGEPASSFATAYQVNCVSAGGAATGNTNANANTNSNLNGNTNSNANTNTSVNSNANSNTNSNANTNANSNANTNTSTVTTAANASGVILATELLKMNVNDQTGNKLASVDDVIVNPQTGELRYLVVSISADIGNLNGKWVLVPIQAASRFLGYDAQNNALVLMFDTTKLSQAPFFSKNELPDTSQPDWDMDISSFWSSMP